MTNITGTAGPDLLTSGDNGDILTGLGDSDTLFGTGDNDRLSGNAGGVGRDWYFDVGAVLDHVEATNHTFTADEIENIIASSAPLPPPGDLLTRRCAAGPRAHARHAVPERLAHGGRLSSLFATAISLVDKQAGALPHITPCKLCFRDIARAELHSMDFAIAPITDRQEIY